MSSPSLAPEKHDHDIYLVVDNLGREYGQIYHETDHGRTDFESVISDLLSGHYDDPIRVESFNTVEGWARDVSEDVARELQRRANLAFEDLPASLADFVERQLGADRERQLALRLVA